MENKCLVRTLQMSTNNENLPIFKKVEVKDFIKTVSDEQYIRLPMVYPRNGVKIDIEFKYLNQNDSFIISSQNGDYLSTAGSYIAPFMDGNRVDYFSVSYDTNILAGYNTETGEVYVNSTEETGTAPSSGTELSQIVVFGRQVNNTTVETIPGQAGKVAIKSIDITIGETVHHIVPALVNDVPCLYNNTTGETYLPNIGTLIVE